VERTFLRRPGTLGTALFGWFFIAFGAVLGLAGLAAAGPTGLLAGAFLPVGVYAVWWTRVSGLVVTPESIVLVSGVLRKQICATPQVGTLALLRTGTVWDAHQEIQFLDGGGAVLGRVVNVFSAGRGFLRSWKPPELERLATEMGWRWQIDLGDSHVTHPPPAYTDDDD
jgi:hypothetical protein